MELQILSCYILVVISTCLQDVSLESVSSSGRVLQRVKRLDPGSDGGLLRVKRLEDVAPKALVRVRRGGRFDESAELTGKARSTDDAVYDDDDDAGLRSTKSVFGSKAMDDAHMYKVILDDEFQSDSMNEPPKTATTKRFDKHFMKIKRNWANTLKKKRQHHNALKKKVEKKLEHKEAREVAKIRKNLKLSRRKNKN